ncbi:sodium/sulphate symporter [beta proteobacterium KB13]|uniref:Sodium/sulphate symporter n=1 Tax=beta proteobacterium KB13 TaxID=314607 RepID=B6BTH0_9PROT|nr:sodium/sulphate symporter [beta proteobacterium KB13]
MNETNQAIKKYGFWFGLVTFLILTFSNTLTSINSEAWTVLSIMLLMIAWWFFEVIPIYVTALLPLILLPLLTNQSFQEVSAPYASPSIFLFLGGFMLAIAIEISGLHKRFAYLMILKFGRSMFSILACFMLVSYFTSMWIINTATALMLLPIALQVCKELKVESTQFEILLLLSIAYSASIGGMSTIIGTAPNVFFVGFMHENFDIQISFLEWMKFALPISAIILFVSFFIFFFLIKKNKNIDQTNWQSISLEKLPTMSSDEVKVLLVFIVTVSAWVFRGHLNQFNFLSNLTDSGIAITSAFLFFLIPSSNKKNDLLQWKHMKQLPWGLLLLFGGGLALAKAIMVSGLGDWLGAQLSFLNNFSVLYIIFVLIFATVFLTEVLSNTALTISFLPIIGVIAVDMGLPVSIIGMAVVMAASCAFMLPIATPPNAVIFSTEKIKVMDMVKVGFIMNILTIFIITSIFYIMM